MVDHARHQSLDGYRAFFFLRRVWLTGINPSPRLFAARGPIRRTVPGAALFLDLSERRSAPMPPPGFMTPWFHASLPAPAPLFSLLRVGAAQRARARVRERSPFHVRASRSCLVPAPMPDHFATSYSLVTTNGRRDENICSSACACHPQSAPRIALILSATAALPHRRFGATVSLDAVRRLRAVRRRTR